MRRYCAKLSTGVTETPPLRSCHRPHTDWMRKRHGRGYAASSMEDGEELCQAAGLHVISEALAETPTPLNC
jgi:hypothetical protein